MDGAYTFHEYSCALCPNRVNLTETCCCKDTEGGLVEVTDPRLIKRANLQRGDKLCAKHLEKLKSGMIFGHKNGCCAPFHVETSPGRRLRNVPRSWRSYFDNTDFSPRYMPALQICDACYNITLDVLFDSSNGIEDDGNSSADFLPTSSANRYLSPRRWISSQSLHNLDSNSESSSWSVSSPRKKSKTFLSLYASSREKYGHPKLIPASVRRYLLSRADTADGSDTSSVKMPLSRRESELSNQSLASSQDLNETPESAKALAKFQNSERNALKASNGVDEESKVSKTLTFNDSQLETVHVVSTTETETSLALVDGVTNDHVNGNDHISNAKNDEDSFKVATTKPCQEQVQPLSCAITDNALNHTDEPSADATCETHEFVNIPDCTDLELELNQSHIESDNKEAVTTSLHTAGKPASHVERMSHALANEIVFFVLNYFSTCRGSRSLKGSYILPTRDTSDKLEVFANTLASSFVNFAIDESRRQVGTGCIAVSHKSHKPMPCLENFGEALSNVILADVRIAIQELHACCQCRGKILKHCESVVSFAQKEAERIMSTALAMFQNPRFRLEQEKLATDIVDKAISSALLLVQFETKQKNGNTEVAWIEDKQCYRTVFSITVNAVNNTESDKKEPDLNSSSKMPRICVDKSETVDCYVDDLLPVTRSLSNGFIDQAGTDEEVLPQTELRKAVSNDSIFLMVCEPVSNGKLTNGEEVLVKNLNAAHLPEHETKFIRKPTPPPNTDVHNGDIVDEGDGVIKDADVSPVEILTFYPSSNEDEVMSDISLASSSSVSSSLDEILNLSSRNVASETEAVTDLYNRTEENKCLNDVQEVKLSEVLNPEDNSNEKVLSTQTDNTRNNANDLVKEVVSQDNAAMDQDAIRQVENTQPVALPEEKTSTPTEDVCGQEKIDDERIGASYSKNLRKSLTFDESPLMEEKSEDKTSTSARKIPSTLHEEEEEGHAILPQINTMFHRRRTQQFNRAVSDAEIVRNRCRSAMLPGKKADRNSSETNPEDVEPDDTADVICSTIADATPTFLRRVPPRNEQETEEYNSKTRVILKAVTFVGFIGVLFYAGWKYYYM